MMVLRGKNTMKLNGVRRGVDEQLSGTTCCRPLTALRADKLPIALPEISKYLTERTFYHQISIILE